MKYLERSQLRAVLSEAKKDSERNWLMLLLSYNHGLRVSEVIALEPGNFRDGFLSVRRLKGSLHTIQELVSSSDPLFDERSAIQNWKGLGRLFPFTRQAAWKILQKYTLRASVPKHLGHPHALKHTCGHNIIENGIHYTKQYLGHKSMASTGEYLKVSDASASKAVMASLGG